MARRPESGSPMLNSTRYGGHSSRASRLPIVLILAVSLAACTTALPPLGRLQSDPPGQGGCWAWPGGTSGGRLVFSAPGGSAEAWVNLFGRDTVMHLADGQERFVLEDTGHAVYVTAGFTLRTAFEVDVPAPPDEECGHYTIKGSLTLEEADGRRTVLRVNGACGS